ncbi:hypothetical protein [Lysinibacillus fusiformis]|uniref:hypothetical protein n=1 Tax=Lysinibacillus fusiformis TaxID=28031 RepID=UPI0021BE0F3E|nr:hypothetical protein [Lysinibacillus fusiformis]UXJ67819.1 hypothetical protein N5069_16795 [Lysinibacillus fusiformis]
MNILKNKIFSIFLLLFIIISSLLLLVYVIWFTDTFTKIIYGTIVVTTSVSLGIFVGIGIVTLPQFCLLCYQLLFTTSVVPFVMVLITQLFIYMEWESFNSLIIAMSISFIGSLILVFLIFKKMNESFIGGELDESSISNLSSLTNFLTFLITMILLFYSTFSSDKNDIEINNLKNRLDTIEYHLSSSNTASTMNFDSNAIPESQKENVNYSNYYYMFFAMIIYVLASYYTLLPIIIRRKEMKIHSEKEINIPIRITEKAEIELLLKMKDKHLQSYDKNNQKLK